MKSTVFKLALAVTTLWLSACEQPAETVVTGDPVNSGTVFDRDNPSNIVGALYDEAVAGLGYSCVTTAGFTYDNATDAQGEFVCPKSLSVRFWLGNNKEVVLGEVALKEFSYLPYAAIPVARLAGLFADGFDDPAINRVILLQSLRLAGSDDLLVLPPDIDDYITGSAVEIDFSVSPAVFRAAIAPLVSAVAADHALAGNGEVATVDQARKAIVASSMRVRAGFYQSFPLVWLQGTNNLDTSDPDYQSAVTQQSLFISRSGHIRGFGYLWAIGRYFDPAYPDASLWRFHEFVFSPESTILSDSNLANFGTDPLSAIELEFSGRFIGDVVYYSESALEGAIEDTEAGDASVNIPASYVMDPADVGRWKAVPFDGPGDYSGEFGVFRSAVPSITLEPLPAPYAYPIHYTVNLLSYPDGELVTDVQRVNPGYGTSWGAVSFSILANGDIVSDIDADCEAVDMATGTDSGGDPEDVIGLVGSISEVDDAHHMSIVLMIADRDNPAFGLQFGYPSLFFTTLPRLALRLEDMTMVASASCTSTRCQSLEWANDMAYARASDVVYQGQPVNSATSSDLREDMRQNGLYGRLSSGAPTACPP